MNNYRSAVYYQRQLERQQNAALANFSLLVKAGALAGAVKGMLDQPKTYVLNEETNEFTPKQYSIPERLGLMALNSAAGAGGGLLLKYQKDKLLNAAKVGFTEKVNQVKTNMGSRYERPI